MDRRHFCKIASLAVGALGLGALPAGASVGRKRPAEPTMPAPGCRLTIVRRGYHPDLQALFLDDPDAGPCPTFDYGDEFHFSEGERRPDGFCPRLWETVCATIYQAPCSKALSEGTMIIACPDGTRPVIVRIDYSDKKS